MPPHVETTYGMWDRKWGSMSGLLVCLRGLLPIQVAHQILVELIFGLAGLLVADIRTFVVFERHANIVAHGRRSNHEVWPPLWMAPGRSFAFECLGQVGGRGACGNDRHPSGPRPAILARGSVVCRGIERGPAHGRGRP